jgi:hypothetical protein
LVGCARDPAWAHPGAGRLGDATITGEPLAVPRFAAAPRLDGRLDDDCWRTSALLGGFVDPGPGGAPRDDDPVAGFAHLGWDAERLHLAVLVRDRAPESPFDRDADDPHIWGYASGVELMLQPGDPGDNRDYYELQIDVHGARFDSHFDDYNAPISGSGAARRFGHQEWSSQAERAVSVARGRFYAVEASLPWAALAPARTAVPPRPGDVWRLNVYTFRDGQRRALAWSPLEGQGNFHRASRFGRVRFVE